MRKCCSQKENKQMSSFCSVVGRSTELISYRSYRSPGIDFWAVGTSRGAAESFKFPKSCLQHRQRHFHG